jgi:multidrug efflux pump subunit AcrB
MNMRRRTIVLVLGFLVLAGVGYLVYRSVSVKPVPEPPSTSATDTEPLPTIVVEAVCPGADAQVVAYAIADPVEQKVKGVDGLLHMRSQSASDGTYTLTITFQRGTDLNAAQVLVQNRLDLAWAILPDAVKQSGFRVRKEVPGVLLIATLSAPEGRHDRRYLSNYADSQLKDTLAQLAGVARVRLVGQGGEGLATLGGRPVVAFVLSRAPGARPRDISTAVQTRLTQLRAKLPEGLALDVVFDSTAGPGAAEYLGIDVVLPDASSTERTQKVVRDCEAAMARAVGGVRDVLALPKSPFDRRPAQSNRAYVLVSLHPAGKDRASRESIIKSIRDVLHQIPYALLRLSDLGAPGALANGGYALRLAVHTGGDLGMLHLETVANAIVAQSNKKPALIDVFSPFRANTPLPDKRLGPTVIDRLDLELMAEITANPFPGVSLAEARAQLEEYVRTTLPKEYRLTWLSEMPPAEAGK